MNPGSSVKYANLADNIDGAEFVDHKNPNKDTDGLIRQILKNFPELKDSPIIAYYANNEIPQLEKHIHSITDKENINNNCVHIFLFEPLCFYKVPEKPLPFRLGYHNFGFYSELSSTININDVRSLELDSIAQYVTNNDIYNAKVYLCEYNPHELVHYESFFTMITSDQFLRATVMFDNVATEFPEFELHKHFISTNWRFTSTRNIISSLLCLENAHLGWTFHNEWENLQSLDWIKENSETELAKYVAEQFSILNTQVPRCVDLNATKADVIAEPPAGHFYPAHVERFNVEFNPVSFNRFTLPLQKYYNESFVDIVNESRYAQPISCISEKTFQPIQFFRPFVLAAPALSLQYLKELDFRTFDNWWDESYDQERDNWKRLEKIYKVINTISNFSLSECEAMLKDMKPNLEHNFRTLCNFIGPDQIASVPEWDEKIFNVQHRNE